MRVSSGQNPSSVGRRLTRLCCLGWLLLLASPARAQYRFDHWTADNGLPQNSVRDILQTRDGYLWLTTFDGLVRFDGVHFTIYNKSNSPGITTNRFVSLFEDAYGDLWICTEDWAVVRLHAGRFTTYAKGRGLPGGEIASSMGDDGHGNLVYIDEFYQAYRWLDGQFRPASEVLVSPGPAEKGRTQHLANRVSLGGHSFFDGKQVFRSSDNKWVSLTLAMLVPVRDQQGEIWFSTAGGLRSYVGGQFVRREAVEKKLPGKDVRLIYGQLPLRALSVDQGGALWLTTLDSARSELVTRHPPEGLAPLLKDDDLGVVYADREDNLWFGTLRHGLFRARRQVVTAFAKEQGLDAREVYPILEDRQGAIWIGTAADGIFSYRNGAFRKESDASVGIISSLFEDRRGRLWNGKGMIFKDGKVVPGYDSRDLKKEMDEAVQFCWTYYEDQEGAIWLGTNGGLIRYKDDAVVKFTTKDGLAGDDVKVIIPDTREGKASALWIGTYGGLTYYQDGRFTSWTERDGLAGRTVRSLYQDRDGVLWIGTYDSGLGRFKDGKFTRYTTSEGLFDNGVFQILEDDSGWFWMGCNRGIYRVRKQELNDFADGKIKAITAIAFGKSDGMVNVECNGGRWPAGIKARDGKLWFPTMGGVAVIDPATVTTNNQPPPVLIESALVDRQQVALGNEMQIAPHQSDFEIRYTALSFINSENIRFKYKLEGLDQDWVDVGTRRTAYFTHIAPGQYTFRVIAANSDGVWNMEGQALRINVLPPFYRTWWFLSLIGLSIIGAGFMGYRYRIGQLERRHAEQQAFARQLIDSQEAERQRISAELHDSLGQHLLIIRNRAALGERAAQDPVESRNQFDEITASATQAIAEVRAISQNLRPVNLDRLGLSATIEEMVEKVAASSGIQFSADIEPLGDGILTQEQEINSFRVVQESINNIVKHAQATKAYVEMWRENGELRVTVRDNGRGFAIGEAGNGPARGLGLTSMAERVRILEGTFKINSAPGEGTTLDLRIPIGRKGVKNSG
jgi:signal transduction histidine kinase/ligand-binding sensor domain-containing protein